MKKYELTNEAINFKNKKLFRIRALKDFGYVKSGDLGGYVENENNLAQENNCWIYHNAKVYDDAKVFDNGWVFENAEVYENAWVFGDAEISGNLQIFGDAKIRGNANFYGVARGSEKADDILFALQVMYGQPKYTYRDFQMMDLSQTEINEALEYVEKKGYNKFSYFNSPTKEFKGENK